MADLPLVPFSCGLQPNCHGKELELFSKNNIDDPQFLSFFILKINLRRPHKRWRPPRGGSLAPLKFAFLDGLKDSTNQMPTIPVAGGGMRIVVRTLSGRDSNPKRPLGSRLLQPLTNQPLPLPSCRLSEYLFSKHFLWLRHWH